MSYRLKYERFLWFHNNIKLSKHPNTRALMSHFEISQRTADRDIEFMRDRLGAPLYFNRSKNGYEYLDNNYELPSFWMKEDELIAFCIATRLISTVPDVELKETLKKFLLKFLKYSTFDDSFDIENIQKKISVKNIEYQRVSDEIFRSIVEVLLTDSAINITYYSPHRDELTMRTILPLHLLHYMGNWHIVAYCTKRKGIRNFALSRIKNISKTYEDVHLPQKIPSIKEYLRRNFGIIQSGKSKRVILMFSPTISSWIKELIWHPAQKTRFVEDGSLLLTIPVSDYKEIKREILKFGSDVKVIAPEELKEEIRDEINKMNKLY